MSFRLQIKGLDDSSRIVTKIRNDLQKMNSSLGQQPLDMSVVLVPDGRLGRFKCSINWMPKRKHGVHVEKTKIGAYSTFKAALQAIREATRRQSGRYRKSVLGI